MGLSQDFKFKYNSVNEVKAFIQSLSDNFTVQKLEDHYRISSKDKTDFSIHLSIEPFGIRCDRSGEYFKFVGILIEELTGNFGKITIEDV